jgi:hypothetical protein
MLSSLEERGEGRRRHDGIDVVVKRFRRRDSMNISLKGVRFSGQRELHVEI